MAIAFVQGQSNSGSAGSSPQALTAFSSSVAAGDLIVVLAGGDGGSTGLATGVTDSLGNTYTRVPSFDIANAAGTLNLDCFYAVVAAGHTGASDVISLAFNSASENCVIVAQHFNGFIGTPTFDKKSTSSNASSTTTTSGATAALAQVTELVVGLGIHASTVSAFTLGTGYTNLTTVSIAARQAAMESKVVAATTAVTATFTIAAARVNIGGVVTFYDLAAGSPSASVSPSASISPSISPSSSASLSVSPSASLSPSASISPSISPSPSVSPSSSASPSASRSPSASTSPSVSPSGSVSPSASPSPPPYTRIWSSGAELQSLADEVSTLSGTPPTIETSIVRSGAASYKFVSTTAPAASALFTYQFQSADANGGFYLRSYIYFATPPVADTTVLAFTSGVGAQRARLRVSSDGTVSLVDNTSQIGSKSAAMSTNTWHRLELFYFNNTGSGFAELEGRIDGVSFASTTTSTNTGGVRDILVGASDQVTFTCYHDDIAINSGAWPGDGQIVHLYPNAAGDNNGFVTQVGGTAGAANNFTRVDEVTPDDITSYNGDVTSGHIDDFNIQDTPPSIGSSDTINVVQVGVRYRAAVASAEAGFKVRIKKAAAGTVTSSAQITPNSTTWKTNANAAPNNHPLTSYLDPDNASYWTKSTLDSAQIGYTISATNTNAADISTVWLLVDSTPAVGGISPSSSVSPSASISPSISPSSSVSPSASISASISPSASVSPSSSSSRSVSPSASVSPSSSSSLSVSPSSSVSPSASVSPSISPSSSVSPSSSSSLSVSPSSSISPSISPSSSVSSSISASISPSSSFSASPSVGYADYSRGSYVSLPTDNADLTTAYSAQDYADVSSDNDVRVAISDSAKFVVHQYKNFVGTNTSCDLHWQGQTDLAPAIATVTLQIYNQSTPAWETVATNNSASAGADFDMNYHIVSLTNYRDADNVLSSRIYQSGE